MSVTSVRHSLPLLHRPGATNPAAGIRIRPLTSGDTRTVTRVFDGLSPQSRVLRFHAGVPRLTQRMARHLADTQPDHHHAVVAWMGEVPVGLARWIRLRDRPGTAELAVEVVDDFHGRGIGSRLVREAARTADGHQIHTFLAVVHPEHRRLRRWLEAHRAHLDGGDPDSHLITVSRLLGNRP